MSFLKLFSALFVAYAAIVGLAYVMQTRMLFPSSLAAQNPPLLPRSAVTLELVTPDSERLRGVRIPPTEASVSDAPILLGFGGNAWNANSMAIYLHELFPEREVIAFHYRGYSPSTGRPGAAVLQSDAVMIFDHVRDLAGHKPIVGTGFSIGSAIAVHLAGERPIAGLILVSPFDSLKSLAAEHFPWLPVRWLLRHHMEPAAEISRSSTPVAVIAAELDSIVPPHRTAEFLDAVPNLVFHQVIDGADHNDLYNRSEYRSAMIMALDRIDDE